MSELTDAIKAGDAGKVSALADASPDLLQQAEEGVTPILLALYHGKVEIARALAARAGTISFGEACALGEEEHVLRMLGSDPTLLDSRSADGYPALGLAIFFRNGPLARLLIERGADVNAPARNANRVSPVHAAAAVQDLETMRMLLEHGADANATQQLDYTALHGAASRGDIDMGRLLLAHGAQRAAKGTDGVTPADVARNHGHPEFAEWIRGESQPAQ